MATRVDVSELDAAVARLVAATAGPSSDATDSSASSSEGPAPPKRPRRTPRKRGKPTYYIRKDEIGELQDQVKQLQAELQELRASGDTSSLRDAHALMGLYVDGIERNNLALAGTQSILASSTLHMMKDPTAVPLATYIHLPVDPTGRDEILRTMRGPKLQAAFRYMTERLRFLDLRVPHRQGECFDLPDGDAVNSGFDVIPFDSQYTLRDVYEEFQFWLRHQEITISEKAGILTIRESDDIEEFTYGQSRLLTTVLDGVEIESNLAMFMMREDGTPEKPGFALSTIDFVDQDDLYPYRSTEIGRKEMTGAVMLVEVPLPSGERAVSMCRWSYVCFRGPRGGINSVQQGAVRETMLGLCDFMPKMIAERLALRAKPTPASTYTMTF